MWRAGVASSGFDGRRHTGKLDGDTLALDYPGADGQIITIKLHKSDSSAFDTALAALRNRVTGAKDEADQAAAEQQAREDAARLADGAAPASQPPNRFSPAVRQLSRRAPDRPSGANCERR